MTAAIAVAAALVLAVLPSVGAGQAAGPEQARDSFVPPLPRAVGPTEIATVYPGYSDPTEPIVVNFIVNQEPKGDLFVQRDRLGAFFIRMEDLSGLGLKADEARSVFIRNERYVPLGALKDSTAVFDEKTLTITIVARTVVSPRTVIDLTPPPQRKNVFYPRDTSLFLNYGLTGAFVHPEGAQSYSLVNKFGAHAGDLLFLTDTTYTKTEQNDKFARLMSSVTYERRGDLQWFVAGDQFVSSGMLGSTVNLGGLGVSKVYRLDPYFIRQPLFSLSGAATFPSTAEIYVDGMLVSRHNIRPGEFDLQNLNYYGGARTLEVQLRDPFGNVQRVTYPAYFSDALLRKGLHEYSYSTGLLRQQYGVVNSDYGEFAFSALHRYGVSDRFNIGGRAEGSDGLYNGGLQAAFLLPAVGTITVHGAGSVRRGETGKAGAFIHTYQRKAFYTNLSARAQTRDYQVVSGVTGTESPRIEASAAVGLSAGHWGGFSLGYADQVRYSGSNTGITSVSWSKTLTRKSSVSITGRTIRAEATSFDVFLGLHFVPEPGRQVTAQYQRTGSDNVEMVQYQKNTPIGEGVGYRATIEHSDRGDVSSSAVSPFVQYNARYGTYTLDGRAQKESGGRTTDTVQVGAAGSLVYGGGYLGLSRPVDDSFGIVVADGLQDVKVKLNGMDITTVGRDGMAIIPTLGSYGENRVALDAGAVPMDVSLSGASSIVSPSQWSGSCISFEATRVRAVVGRITVLKAGRSVPVEFRDVTMRVGDRDVSFMTGTGGEFYFENVLPAEPPADGSDSRNCSAVMDRYRQGQSVIQPGIHDAVVVLDGQRCDLRITVPISDDVMIDIGEVPCILPDAKR